MSIGIGLCVNNTRAVLEALFGKQSEFARTPKYGIERDSDEWVGKKYHQSVGVQPIIELALGLYFTATVFYALANQIYGTLPFLMLFQIGFLYTGLLSILQQFAGEDVMLRRRKSRSSDPGTWLGLQSFRRSESVRRSRLTFAAIRSRARATAQRSTRSRRVLSPGPDLIAIWLMTTDAKPKAGLEDVVAATSAICYLDGDRGVLAYCGYDIHDLARGGDVRGGLLPALARPAAEPRRARRPAVAAGGGAAAAEPSSG